VNDVNFSKSSETPPKPDILTFYIIKMTKGTEMTNRQLSD
jgi:hypothetical protein